WADLAASKRGSDRFGLSLHRAGSPEFARQRGRDRASAYLPKPQWREKLAGAGWGYPKPPLWQKGFSLLPQSPRGAQRLPAAGARSVYAPPGSKGRLFASVEVGGLLRSEDGGATWVCEPVIDDDDIHFITGHPRDAGLLFAALGYAGLPGRRRAEGYRFGGV